jgi:hypothetical protein
MTLYDPMQVEALRRPAAIEWRPADHYEQVCINGYPVGWMTKRPGYCDRGRYAVDCTLPGIDAADGFPRYYMSREVAVSETEAFLKWRLWRQVG